MNVKLLAYTENPERVVALAAKLCYSNTDVETLGNNITEQSSKDFVKLLFELGHESPVEHVNFTFAVEGVSRALLAQLTRHRIASYSVQSQRYVKLDNFKYIVPPEIESDDKAKEMFISAMESSLESYNRLTEVLLQKYIKQSGKTMEQLDKKQLSAFEKKAIEDARFVLPNACETKIVFTMNARSLYNFFKHRLCYRAQWEIRQMSLEMLKLVFEKAPELFSGCGPSCLNGACSEGRMSCKNQKQVKQDFAFLK